MYRKVLLPGCGDAPGINVLNEKRKTDIAWRHKGKTDIFDIHRYEIGSTRQEGYKSSSSEQMVNGYPIKQYLAGELTPDVQQ